MAQDLQLFNGLAVVLIAFVAGLEMNLQRLRPRLRAMLELGGVTILTMYTVLFVVFWTAWPWIGIAPELSGLQRAAVAMLLTTVVASFSPTVTIALIAESRAAGPLSELTVAVVILADLVLILLFTLVMQLVRHAFGGAAEIGLLVSLSWEIFGSFAFGAVVGALFAFYLHHVGREVPVVLLAMCAVIGGLGAQLHLEPLLAALAAGLVVENIAPPRGDLLKRAVERGALPVLVVFFAAAGASLQLSALATIGGVAAAVAGLRGGTDLGGHEGGRQIRADCTGDGATRVERARLAGGRHAGADADCRGRVPGVGCDAPDAHGRAHRHPPARRTGAVQDRAGLSR